jgi:hypothetical protein
MLRQIQQFGHRPDVIGYPGFHGRGYAQRSMHNAKIVMGKVEAERCLRIFQLPRECQRQTRESRKTKPQRQVVSLYKAGGNVSRIRVSASNFGYNLRDSWWGVPPVRTIMLSVVAKQLGQLSKVRVPAEGSFDGLLVKM